MGSSWMETGNFSAGEGKRIGTARWEREESQRNRLSSYLPTPCSVSSSEFSEAHRQNRGGRREGLTEEEEGVKGDEKGSRKQSGGQGCVMKVQSFRA